MEGGFHSRKREMMISPKVTYVGHVHLNYEILKYHWGRRLNGRRGSDRGNEIAKRFRVRNTAAAAAAARFRQGAKDIEAGACGLGKPNVGCKQIVPTTSTFYASTTSLSSRINQADTVKMVVMYNIAGRQIASHWLSIATLSITFGGAALAMGGKKVEKTTTPPINAKNNDEEKFIKDFLADMDSSEKKAQKA
ncbi:hypothetical protein V493_08350 [Pseudogymnoascus sp. VKM F-4281 (FW-2241)]|nr:hypothetical protein V493_08350 [Pseudogymnoascus sp. VKM F-4281 (FW-2241)]